MRAPSPPGTAPGRAPSRSASRAFTIGLATTLVGSLMAGAPAAQATPDPAVPTFVDGLAQPVFATAEADWINSELWVESEIDSDHDGKLDRIHVDVSRPTETETDGLDVPVVYAGSPYYAGGSNVTEWGVDHEIGFPTGTRGPWDQAWTKRPTSPTISRAEESTWVPRGFAVVHAESIGTGQSQGCPTVGDVNETLGAKAVIDWLNGRAKGYTSVDSTEEVVADWTTGKVGMIGASYDGTLANAVASTGVEGLEAVVSFAAISNWYDYYRANGHVVAAGGYQGEDADVLGDYVHSRADRSVCRHVIQDIRDRQDRATGDYNAFWDERNYLNSEDNVKAATLIVHGLDDWNVKIKQSVQWWEALEDNGIPRQMYLHQGGHSRILPADMANRWFTRFLYGHRNGVEDLPKAYVVPQGGSSDDPTAYADWPVPGSAPVKLNFTRSTDGMAGSLGLRGSIGLPGLPEFPAGTTETLVDDAARTLATLANTRSATAASHTANRLIYKTPPLTRPVRLSGTPVADLKVAFSKPAANISVALVDYDPAATGSSDMARVVTRGWIDPQNHGNLDGAGTPLVPGQEYTLKFDAVPHDWVFAAGRRIGVVIYSSDRQFTVRPATGTELAFNTQASSITLPIVGGVAALAGSTRGSAWPAGALPPTSGDRYPAPAVSHRGEASPSPVYGAALLMRFGSQAHREFKSPRLRPQALTTRFSSH